MIQKTRLLIIDDSRLIRTMIRSIVSNDPSIEVVGEAADPFEAREKIKNLNPDVVTLDVEMPKMDGLSFLEKIMSLRPMPVVMVSTLTQKGADVTIRALELGAVDYVAKPLNQDLTVVGPELISKIKIARCAKVRQSGRQKFTDQSHQPLPAPDRYSKKIIAIGSSTGGVESLYEIILRLPTNCPPVVIAQHISKGFSERFAVRVNKTSAVTVKEACSGEKLQSGTVYIGQGGKHLTIRKSGYDYICQVTEDTEGESYRPSVDRLFCSVADVVAANAVGVILTGMGKDGARGLLTMRRAGAATLGQDEASAIVYGMPKAAMMAGAVEKQVSLSNMAEEIITACTATTSLRKAGAA
ncbi:MAG: chemotaxis response regulator protein-glutamate methylesterase [Emcibacter sp.]|nr:chemotaxis response regulator protein-glutamate methylesterase [Emcibacter sp.]